MITKAQSEPRTPESLCECTDDGEWRDEEAEWRAYVDSQRAATTAEVVAIRLVWVCILAVAVLITVAAFM